MTAKAESSLAAGLVKRCPQQKNTVLGLSMHGVVRLGLPAH